MTTVADQLAQYGGAPVGMTPRFAGLWSGRCFFVDGTNGLDGNSGLSPARALQTLATAISKAGTNDTIYIKPLAVGTRYTENVTVPVSTHAGLSIIGTGNGAGRSNSVYQACNFRGVLAVDDPVITWNSSFGNVENIGFWSRAAQTVDGFGILARWNTPVGLALNIGSSIVNCSFTADVLDAPAGAGVTQNAIRFDSTEGQVVQGCTFQDCRSAISIGSTQSASYAIQILDNIFAGVASNIAADIYMTDVQVVNILRCIFGHAVPSNAAGSLTKYIYVAGTATGSLGACFQAENEVAAGTNNTLSTILSAGNFGLGGPWTS